MPEDRPNSPAISTSRVSANEVVRHTFVTVRRGFDPTEVRSYLELVARELQAWEQRDEDLREQLAEVQERAQHPVIDEASLTAALGQQSAQVLRNAHEEAARLALQAEQTATTLVREAQQQATEIMIQAESAGAERIAEAELAASGVRQETDQQTADRLAAARDDGAALLEQAREQGQAMIEQAQAARRQVLTDMAHRRRLMTVQIDQFRAARDELAASVLGVRDSVDRVVDDLSRADDAARASAADVARRQPAEPGDDELLAEAEVVVAALDLDLPATGPPVHGADGGPDPGGDPTVAVDRIVVPDIDAPLAPPPGPVPFDADSLETGGARAGAAAPSKQPSKPTQPKASSAKAATRAAPPAAGEATLAVPANPAARPTATDPVTLASPAPPAATEAVPGGGFSGDSSVEDLFARLRAGRPDEGPPPSPPPATAAQGATTPPGGTPPVPSAEGEPPAAGTDGAPVADGVDPGVAQRAELLDPVVTKLARRLKRALQDDQNRLLDQLRAGSGAWDDGLLSTEEAQRRAYAEAAVANLADAAAAGIAFARRRSGARGAAPKPDPKVADALADALAGNIVALLRRRLTGPEGAGAGGSDDATERVGAAYREWRGERIERLVGDVALGAFSAGVLAATPSGTGVHWVLGGTGAGCADCDDNALAGDVAPGEEFPTGHKHPPAHAGCRCLVVPTPA